MKIQKKAFKSALCTSALLLCSSMSSSALADNGSTVEFNPNKPWKDIQDSNTAANNPDLYAWQLFVSLNWPGDPATCKPDPGRFLGASGATAWQMWRNRDEIFLANAEKPKTWKKGCKDQNFIVAPEGDHSNLADEEVRLSRAAFSYIRSNKLYSLDEQERLAQQGVKDLDFPIGSKEVKAHWVRINEDDKPRYQWIEVERQGVIDTYGLSGFHITSKDLPSWFWATFEHVDNESRWNVTYPDAFRGWEVPSVDSASCPADNLACNDFPKGMGIENTVWENYRLRGTQVEWADNRGKPTVLTNSQLEGFLDQGSMSCITCHSLSVKGTNGPAMPIFMLPGTVNDEGLPHGYIGPIDPALFEDIAGNEVQYLGLDYVWTLRNAQREAQ